MTGIRMVEDVRGALRDRIRALPTGGETRMRTRRLRAILQESGVRCDDTAAKHDVDAAVLASERGVDAMIASRLDDEQREVAYARIIARLLSGGLKSPMDFKAEYANSDDAPYRKEREEERMVVALARAITSGQLDTAPRPIFEDVPAFTLAFTPRTAARSTLGGFHWWSGYWYKRSNMYRSWRSRTDVSNAIERVCGILNRASAPAA